MPDGPVAPGLRQLLTPELTPDDVLVIRAVLDDAFGDDEDQRFTEDDWQHALGGTHVVADLAGAIVAHAAVLSRRLFVAGRPIDSGYVEAVAVAPSVQGQGVGTLVMEAVNAIIRDRFELGALGTGSHHFYERLGWETWRGPSSVRLPSGQEQLTSAEDGFILVLRTPRSPALTLTEPITCELRPGDVW